jgi:hypothetical protein
MRILVPAFAAVAFLLSVQPGVAQVADPVLPPVTAPATPPQAKPQAPAPKPARATRLQNRFEAANTTHDGHLTLAQAKADKWAMVVKNFSQIDKAGKGYVTLDELRAAAAAARAARTTAPAPVKS